MAVWGSGDPRWHVRDLGSDGKNVGSWHWEDKQRLDWSKQRLAELLEGLEAEGGAARLTKLKSCTGEAMLTIRKGNKKFAVYDLKLTLGWEGEWPAEDEESPASKVSGEVSISEFASMHEHDEIEFAVTVTGSGAGTAELKRAVEALRPAIFEQLDRFAGDMLES